MTDKYMIITHTDMDGVGSASLYIYYMNKDPVRIVFTEPYFIKNTVNMIRDISKDYVEKIVFMDLGLNPSTYEYVVEALRILVDKGIHIEWYDHHVWDDLWVKGFREAGIELYLDQTTCATGVVAKYAKPQRRDLDREFIQELVAGVCAGDLWRFDHWRGPWFLRLVRRRESNKWRLHVLKILSKGVIWCKEFTDNILYKLERELEGYNRISDKLILTSINGIGVAIVPAVNVLDSSFVAAYILGRTGADIAVIASKDGKLSFRSRDFNVRELAVRLGGGGHPRAAGAKIEIPFRIRIKMLFNNDAYLDYVKERVLDVLKQG